MNLRLWAGAAAVVVALVACGDDDDDSGGSGGSAGAAAGAAGDAGAAGAAAGAAGDAGAGGEAVESLAAIQVAIFDTSCSFSSCHSAEGNRGGLVLGKSAQVPSSDVHKALVGVVADIDPSFTRVKAGDPDGSFLLDKLHAASGGFKVTHCDEKTNTCGDPMPQGSALDPELIARIERWIKQGALDN